MFNQKKNKRRMSNTKFGVELAKRCEKVKAREGWYYTNLSLM